MEVEEAQPFFPSFPRVVEEAEEVEEAVPLHGAEHPSLPLPLGLLH